MPRNQGARYDEFTTNHCMSREQQTEASLAHLDSVVPLVLTAGMPIIFLLALAWGVIKWLN